MSTAKRILILTADAGFGHRSAAKALAAALEESHGTECVFEVVNPLDHEKTPSWLRDVQSDYDRIAREAARLYKLSYDMSDTGPASRMMENAMKVLLFRSLRDIVLRFRPDSIVTTFPLYMAPLNALFTLRRSFVPVVCVVTDLATVHQIWFSNDSDLTIVPTETVRSLALAAGLSAERVEVIGIPVHPRIGAARAALAEGGAELGAERREAQRLALGLEEGRTTLLAVGSKRSGGLEPILDILNHSGLPLQFIAVAGGDPELLARLGANEWHLPARVLGLVDNMPELMRAADLVVSKAGGLIVTESLAAGLPLLLVDIIPGQETGNAQYVVGGGAGEVATDPVVALRAVFHWLADGGRGLAEASSRAAALGRPRAAHDIMERVWELAARGCAKRDLAATAALALRELFGRFDESCEE